MSVQPVNVLDGHRVLIVGASSGIGRVLGSLAAEAGARVAFAARRANLVEDAARDAGNGAISIVCDARDADSCADSVARTVEAFGGLDSFVYSTAVDPLVRLADADADAWRNTLETNVIGAAMICRAALPHLKVSGGRAVFISATSVGRPLPGMGMYISSKAAMEEMIRAWRAEHPDVCFSNVRVGSTLGTEVTQSWDPNLIMELAPDWQARGYVDENGPGEPMSVEHGAQAVLGALASPVCLREISAVNDAGRVRIAGE